MKRRIRIHGFLIFIAAILAIFLSKAILQKWKVEFWDEFFDALGIGLVFFGFLLRIAARGYKEEESLNGKRLVKDGPYALVRNPMYFGTLVIGTGIISVIFQLWILLLFFVIFLLIYIPQVRKEEAILLNLFGTEYMEYCKATPKYLPRFLDLLKLPEYLVLKFAWIRKELLSFLLVVAVVITIEILGDLNTFGKKELLIEFIELSTIILLSAGFIILFFKRNKSVKEV